MAALGKEIHEIIVQNKTLLRPEPIFLRMHCHYDFVRREFCVSQMVSDSEAAIVTVGHFHDIGYDYFIFHKARDERSSYFA